jgi:hypothetical protein
MIQNSYLRFFSIIKILFNPTIIDTTCVFLHVLLNFTTNLLYFYDQNILINVMLEVVTQICYITMRRELKTGLGHVFFPQCYYMTPMNFVVSPPGCDLSVTDVWGWGAHEA